MNSTSDSTHKRRARTSRWIQFAVMAACLALAALAGYGTAMWQKPTPTLATSAPVADTTPQFLLLLYDAPVQGAKPSASEETALIAEYAAWARDLFKKGQMVTAEKLVDNGGQWLGGPAVATDGQTIGGFFLIRAPDATEARRIAATCPHLKHGGRVELRAIQPT